MNYGLYLSAAGMLTNLYRQDVIANNLANLNTVGFKPDMVFTRQRLPARLESGQLMADPKWMLERLGGGQFVQPTRTNMRQGSLVETNNNLDLAIRGDGFFVLASGSGTGSDQLRLTRDGRFALTAAGDLVMAATGMRVLDVNDQPIRLGRGSKPRIGANGAVDQGGQVVANIQIAGVSDPTRLVKAGQNLWRLEGGPPDRQSAVGSVMQGYVESSAVNALTTLNDLISVTKTAQANAKMMQHHDNLIGQAVNTLGRVA